MLLFIDKLGVAGFILLYAVLLLAVGVRHDPSEVLTLLLREFAIHQGVLSLLFLLLLPPPRPKQVLQILS